MSLILVVDDSVMARKSLQSLLEERGYSVSIAGNGREGLEVLEADPDIQIVVSDVHMPNMDGIEFVEAIAEHMGSRALKIVMLTTEHSAILEGRGKELGVVGWMVKPLNPNFPDLIEHILEL